MTSDRVTKKALFVYVTAEEKALILEASHIARKNLSNFVRDTLIERSKELKGNE